MITRRDVLLGSAGALAATAISSPRKAAATETTGLPQIVGDMMGHRSGLNYYSGCTASGGDQLRRFEEWRGVERYGDPDGWLMDSVTVWGSHKDRSTLGEKHFSGGWKQLWTQQYSPPAEFVVAYSRPICAWDLNTSAKKKGDPNNWTRLADGEMDPEHLAWAKRLPIEMDKRRVAWMDIRLGWEMNGGHYPWAVSPDHIEEFRTVFSRYAAMIYEYGPKDRIFVSFDPARKGRPRMPPIDDWWPKDSGVAFVCPSAHDQYAPKETSLDRWIKGQSGMAKNQSPRGLLGWFDWARSVGLPTGLTEYGVMWDKKKHPKGNGDNAAFIEGCRYAMEQSRLNKSSDFAGGIFLENMYGIGDGRLYTGKTPQAAEAYLQLYSKPLPG